MSLIPRIAITPGEPAGIGADIVIALAQHPALAQRVVLADPVLLQQRAEILGLPLTLRDYAPEMPITADAAGVLHCLPIPLQAPVSVGQLNPANAGYVLQTLRQAAEGCLQGAFHALVTGPVNKAVINEAGIAFSGHTEFLAQQCHARLPVMMLVAGELRVALATTHIPLKAVSEQLCATRLETVLQILHQDLCAYFGIPQPRILVCGLNPHAGESGHLGREEIEIITPVIHRLQAQGLSLHGPVPADTAFTPRLLNQADAVLAMYHDQGLPVLKYAGFGQAVNVTLGLPIIRTSVDHGTALELVGTGQADSRSLQHALALAISLCHSRRSLSDGA